MWTFLVFKRGVLDGSFPYVFEKAQDQIWVSSVCLSESMFLWLLLAGIDLWLM